MAAPLGLNLSVHPCLPFCSLCFERASRELRLLDSAAETLMADRASRRSLSAKAGEFYLKSLGARQSAHINIISLANFKSVWFLRLNNKVTMRRADREFALAAILMSSSTPTGWMLNASQQKVAKRAVACRGVCCRG